jgi:hypothetical protein
VPLSVEYDDADARKYLDRVAAMLVDLRPFFPKIVPVFISWMRYQFESEGAYAWGHPWAPLSPGYAAWKAVHYPARGILYAEGDLRMAASQPKRTVTPRTLTLTINDPKLQYHETGTPNMPARPLLFGDPLPGAARADLEQAAEEFIDDWMGRIPGGP